MALEVESLDLEKSIALMVEILVLEEGKRGS